MTYERCPLAAKKQYIDKLPKKAHPNAERGNEIHKRAEDYILGKNGILIPELACVEPLINRFQTRFIENAVFVESPWAFTKDWLECGFEDDAAWTRGLLDVAEWVTPQTHLHGFDWKTGKRYPPKHLQQEQLYCVYAFEKFPRLEKFDFSFIYLDEIGSLEDRMTKRSYTRANALRLKDSFTRRGLRMTNDTVFAPAPNKVNCMWCDFKDTCEWAVK